MVALFIVLIKSLYTFYFENVIYCFQLNFEDDLSSYFIVFFSCIYSLYILVLFLIFIYMIKVCKLEEIITIQNVMNFFAIFVFCVNNKNS